MPEATAPNAAGTGLAQRCALQGAELSLLCGVAEALAKSANIDDALRDVLASCLDAAGISCGALYLEEGSGLQLRHTIGYSEADQERLRTFFEHPEVLHQSFSGEMAVAVPSGAVAEEAGRELLARAGVTSLLVVPLVSGGKRLGALFVGSKKTDVTRTEQIAFARALSAQIGQAVALTVAFARLGASEARFRGLVESMDDAVFTLDRDGRCTGFYGRWGKAEAFDPGALVGRPVKEILPPGALGQHEAAFACALEGEHVVYEWSLPGPGEDRAFETSLSPLRDSAGGVIGAVGVGHEITAQKRLQAQLMMSDRMVSVGMMAAGLAHEINNPLAVVLASVDLALQGADEVTRKLGAFPESADLVTELRVAKEAAERVRRIVKDLRVFSRADEEGSGPVDVHRVIESSLRMAANEIRHRARLVKDLAPVPMVEGNESRLGQVFLNLVVNAAQAIPEGHAESNLIRVTTRLDERRRVSVEVEDTGCGIAPEHLGRLFTPFFTTKPASVGTGLGLSICQRIVAELGGEITVRSEPGGGSVFRVLLPPAKVQPILAAAPTGEPRRPLRRGRVLVVDDEPMVRHSVRRMLAGEHDVVEAQNAREAADRIRGGDRFDAILCDLMMPEATGMDLHEELCRIAADQARRMIFVTGGAFTHGARTFLEEVPNARVEKPFDISSLRALVNELVR